MLRMLTQASTPPTMAPISRGPTCARPNTTTPAPAIMPTSGIPVSTPPKLKIRIPKIKDGSTVATIARRTPPAFCPPTTPAMTGPTAGSQKRSTDKNTIQKIAPKRLPLFSAIVLRLNLCITENVIFTHPCFPPLDFRNLSSLRIFSVARYQRHGVTLIFPCLIRNRETKKEFSPFVALGIYPAHFLHTDPRPGPHRN